MTDPGMTRPGERAPLRVGNCSGFYGDRLAAMREMLDGGPLDVLTGDYLAELTMLILGRQQASDPGAGYARTFVRQLEQSLAAALERGVRIVANAGGLNPPGLAAAVREVAERQGLAVRVATVSGDDLRERWKELAADPEADAEAPLAANAYLGGWGIARALAGGADVVVTGRVTDAALVAGPAAWHHGWTPADLDALAGATLAGHVLECGTQATGGNFSLFRDLLEDLPDDALLRPGFPLAEIAADGSAVVTKHPGTGGAVTVATVTEQLLYECTGVRYGGPDVVTRFDTVTLTQEGPDRVRLSGTRGEPPDGRLKVSVNVLGGFRNQVTLPVVGLDVDAKAALLRRQLAPVLAGVAESSVVLARTGHPDAATEQEGAATLTVSVKDPDPKAVGRRFSGAVVELALASIPGFFPTAPPGDATPYGVFRAAWVPAADVPAVVTHDDGTVETLPSHRNGHDRHEVDVADEATAGTAGPAGPPAVDHARVVAVPLGRVAGARSGDKGGTCTLGVYGRTDAAYAWLAGTLTAARLAELLPEAAGLPVTRELLPNLRAVLFQIHGLLGDGVAAGTRFDPQGKAVGEWLRSRVVDVPAELLEGP
jgi:hypothetical protein